MGSWVANKHMDLSLSVSQINKKKFLNKIRKKKLQRASQKDTGARLKRHPLVKSEIVYILN